MDQTVDLVKEVSNQFDIYYQKYFAPCSFLVEPIFEVLSSLRTAVGLHGVLFELMIVSMYFVMMISSLVLCYLNYGTAIMKDGLFLYFEKEKQYKKEAAKAKAKALKAEEKK